MANEILRRTLIFPAALDKLVEYCMMMESHYFGHTRKDVKEMAFALAEKNGIKHPFKNKIAGRAWFDHFMNRHRSNFSIRKPEATSRGYTPGFNNESVKKNFDTLDTEYEKHQYPPNRIFNVVETRLSIVQSKHQQVVGMKGKKQIGAVTAAERGKLVTIVACMGAGGDYMPPMLIFP